MHLFHHLHGSLLQTSSSIGLEGHWGWWLDAPPKTLNFTHTKFNLDESGPSSVRTSHLPALASPTKKGKMSMEDSGSWNTEPQPDLPDFGDDLDPAYTDQSYEHHLKPPPVLKKKLRGVFNFSVWPIMLEIWSTNRFTWNSVKTMIVIHF